MTLFGLSGDKLALFAFAVALLALTPGPVWIYLISRTLAQGRRAGYFSLIGVMVGVLFHLALAAVGLSAVLLAIPWAFNAIKLAGAAYLLWLAWSTVRGAGFSFSPQPLEHVPDRVLLRQSLLASVVNPKVAVFYLSLFPQFVDPGARDRPRIGVDVDRRSTGDGGGAAGRLVRTPPGMAQAAALVPRRRLRRARHLAGADTARGGLGTLAHSRRAAARALRTVKQRIRGEGTLATLRHVCISPLSLVPPASAIRPFHCLEPHARA